jgi:lipopolysaccharide/colanic/teichoic acid biosynthesis glycosyltransferase
MKRLFDIFFSFFGLIVLSPILLPVIIIVYLQDFYSPFYISPRVGKNGSIFKMIKLRSMIKNADKSGVDSTSANDNRITPIGHFIRRFKLDEITQLINVFIGTMSFVGPRPNIKRETDLYTYLEKNLLKVKPGITDIASIVFSDEGDILKNSKDPDIDYNQLIRPGKSELGLFYVKNSNILLDINLIFITIFGLFSRNYSLKKLKRLLRKYNASEKIIEIASRSKKLMPSPPPGASEIVTER